MPRASLSVGLLSTHTSGVKKKNLHTAIGRPSAFISPAKFRIKTSECTKIQQFFLLFIAPYVRGHAYSISQGVVAGDLYDGENMEPFYWNVATRTPTPLSLDEYGAGSVAAVLNSLMVGQVDGLPCYWDSNVLTILTYSGYVGGAAISTTATIAVGRVGNVPCHWVLSTNQLVLFERLTYDGGVANDIDSTTAVGNVDGFPCYWDVPNNLINVLNSVVSGEAYSIDGNVVVGQLNNQPGYWELPGTTFTELPHEGYSSGVARSIDNNIMVGEVSNNFIMVPCYWDSNRRLHLLPMTVNHKTFTMGEAYSISQNVICGNVQDDAGSRPCYWVI